MIRIVYIFSLAFTSAISSACTIDGKQGIVEKNNLWLSPTSKNVNGIDELEFNRVIDDIVHIYRPLFSAEGGTLIVEKEWENGTVNAYALQKKGKWIIQMYGGLARHQAINSDSFAMIVCHELGHHIGGAPKKVVSGGRSGPRKRWA